MARNDGNGKAEDEGAARRSTLRDSLMLCKGSRSVFWTEKGVLRSMEAQAASPRPAQPSFFNTGLTHQHPGNSKALAVFWDLDRFDVAGDHERCCDAVNAVRSFCAAFEGLGASVQQRRRGALRMTGYARGGQHVDTAREKSQEDAVRPENAGRRAGIRMCSDQAGLKEQALARLIPDLVVVDRDPFGETDEGSTGAVRPDCPQMLTDLLVWMLDCTQRRLFVPTAVVISDDPHVMSALSMLAARGAYTVLLTSINVRERKRGNMQVVLPFEQVVAAHIPLGSPPVKVVDHTAVVHSAGADQAQRHLSPRKAQSTHGTRSPQSRPSSDAGAPERSRPPSRDRQQPATSLAKSPARPPRTRPETSPAKSARDRREAEPAAGERQGAFRPRLSRASRPASARPRAASASGSPRLSKAHEEGATRVAASGGASATDQSQDISDAAGGDGGLVASTDARAREEGAREEGVAAAHHTDAADDDSQAGSPRSSRTWCGVGAGSRGSSPSSPRVPLVGDEVGSACKMWCSWSKSSELGVGEAVSVKRSDGRYTLGVVVGLGVAGHYSTIHECDLAAGEVEILCDFDKKTGQRITRVNRIETVGKFPSSASLAANGAWDRASVVPSIGSSLGRWSALEEKMGMGGTPADSEVGSAIQARPSSVRLPGSHGASIRAAAVRPHVVRPHTALPAGRRVVSFSAAISGNPAPKDSVALQPRKVIPVASQARPLSAL